MGKQRRLPRRASARPLDSIYKLRVAIARLAWKTTARRAAKRQTRARQTTAAVTPSAHARARAESLRVAIAVLLLSTMARRAAKSMPYAFHRYVASTTVPAPTNLARAAGIPTVVAEPEIQDAMSVTCTRK